METAKQTHWLHQVRLLHSIVFTCSALLTARSIGEARHVECNFAAVQAQEPQTKRPEPRCR